MNLVVQRELREAGNLFGPPDDVDQLPVVQVRQQRQRARRGVRDGGGHGPAREHLRLVRRQSF